MSFLYGAPPKVVWLRAGNCSTAEAEAILRRAAARIASFVDDGEESLLILGRES